MSHTRRGYARRRRPTFADDPIHEGKHQHVRVMAAELREQPKEPIQHGRRQFLDRLNEPDVEHADPSRAAKIEDLATARRQFFRSGRGKPAAFLAGSGNGAPLQGRPDRRVPGSGLTPEAACSWTFSRSPRPLPHARAGPPNRSLLESAWSAERCRRSAAAQPVPAARRSNGAAMSSSAPDRIELDSGGTHGVQAKVAPISRSHSDGAETKGRKAQSSASRRCSILQSRPQGPKTRRCPT